MMEPFKRRNGRLPPVMEVLQWVVAAVVPIWRTTLSLVNGVYF